MSRPGVEAGPIALPDAAVVAQVANVGLFRLIAREVVVFGRSNFADHDRVGGAISNERQRDSCAEAIEAAAHVGRIGGLCEIAAALDSGGRLRRARNAAVPKLIGLVSAETADALR